MQITGTLKVIGSFYYLITSDKKKYLIMSDVVKSKGLTKSDEGKTYSGIVANERVISIS